MAPRAYRSAAEVLNVSEWLPVSAAPLPTMTAAKAAARELEDKKWRWADSPGNGKTYVYFACNAHVACDRQLRVAQGSDGLFHISAKGLHAAEKKTKKRKNSILTYEDDETLRSAVDKGSRPGAVHTSMTKEKVSELKSKGEDPLMHKEATGGIAGARMKVESASKLLHTCMNACISWTCMYHAMYLIMYHLAMHDTYV